MKNLIIAALAAAQIMDQWYEYCRSGEDMVWCTLALLYFFLLLLYWVDKQVEKYKRIRNTSNKIRKLTEGERHGIYLHNDRSYGVSRWNN